MSELLIHADLLSPATFDLLWTTAMVGLLLSAATLAAWLLPWSDEEVMQVHNTARSLIPRSLPSALPAGMAAPLTPGRATLER